MATKTGTEVQDIFCWSRQNYRSVIDLIGKEKFTKDNAGGVSYTFNEEEMYRLLDIKIFQLAGCENPKIKKVLSDSDELDKEISNQIRQHEKNILVLKFLRDIRSDIKEYAKLSPEQVSDVNEKSAQLSKMPSLGSPEYYDVIWDLVELVFIIEYLTQNKSRQADTKQNNKKVLTALFIVERLIVLRLKVTTHEDIVKALLDLSDSPKGDEQDLKLLIKDILSEYEEQKDVFLNDFKQNQIEPVTDQTDFQTGEAYRNMGLHFYQFISEYFVGEQELNNLFLCIQDFIYSLDQEKLKVGEIKLIE